MTRPFTGKHMWAVMIAFFGTVIAVNVMMARMAIGTFGGTVVDNSYVASQKFNGWLDAAADQKRQGWAARFSLDRDRHVVMGLTRHGAPDASRAARGEAHHPLGAAPAIALDFAATGNGTLKSRQKLPHGRWQLRVSIPDGNRAIRVAGEAM